MIRSAWLALSAGFWTLVYGTEILVRSAIGGERAERCCRERPRHWCLRLLAAADTEVVLEGVEHLRDGAQILVSNHESWFDVLALAGHLPVEYRFVAKRELENVPVFGPAWKACGHIAIDREDRASAIESLETAARQIHDRDVTIVMFPEGTRSRTGELRPFKKGAFVLAIQARVPVVPVGISGSRRVLAKGSYLVRPGTIRVRVGEPIEVRGLSHADRDRLTERARDAVAALREERQPRETT